MPLYYSHPPPVCLYQHQRAEGGPRTRQAAPPRMASRLSHAPVLAVLAAAAALAGRASALETGSVYGVSDGGDTEAACTGPHTALIATNHKTGTVMALNVANSARKDLKKAGLELSFSPHNWPRFGVTGGSPHSRVLAFVREPHATVVSGALYHKTTTEDWTHRPFRESHKDTHARMAEAARCGLLEGAPPRLDETLQQYMRRAPTRDGASSRCARCVRAVRALYGWVDHQRLRPFVPLTYMRRARARAHAHNRAHPGLLLEAVRALSSSLASVHRQIMAALEDARSGKARIALACLEWMAEEDTCYTRTWSLAAEHLASGMCLAERRSRAGEALRLHAAKRSSFASSEATKKRAKHSTSNSLHLKDGLEKELRDLDSTSPVLRGALARLQAEVPCGALAALDGGGCPAEAGELLSGEALLRWWEGAAGRRLAPLWGASADGDGDHHALLPPMPYCSGAEDAGATAGPQG